MHSRLLSSLTVEWILVLLMCQDSAGKRMWEFEPVSVSATSSNPSKLKVDARVTRVGRGAYAASATVEWNYDVDETTMVEAVCARSASGSDDDYSPIPWSIPKQKFEEFVKGTYEGIIYKNVRDCANLPTPDKAYPWPRNTYIFDKCVFNGEGMPDVLPEAYYKFIFKLTGEVDWTVEMVLKIVKKMLG